jgi:predicted PurR-regulated permease PerM
MALSNMGNEPRRELTETFAGLALIVVLCGLAYPLARWLQYTSSDRPPLLICIPLALGIMAVVFFLGAMGLYVVHELGEGVCGWLAERGWDPRPRQRYGENAPQLNEAYRDEIRRRVFGLRK